MAKNSLGVRALHTNIQNRGKNVNFYEKIFNNCTH